MLDTASRNIGFDFGFYLGGQMASQMNEPMAKLKIYVVVLLDDYAEEFHEVLLGLYLSANNDKIQVKRKLWRIF